MNDDPLIVRAVDALKSEGHDEEAEAVEALCFTHAQLQVENQRLEAALAAIADIAERIAHLVRDKDTFDAALAVFRLVTGSTDPTRVREELPEPYKSAVKNTGGAR